MFDVIMWVLTLAVIIAISTVPIFFAMASLGDSTQKLANARRDIKNARKILSYPSDGSSENIRWRGKAEENLKRATKARRQAILSLVGVIMIPCSFVSGFLFAIVAHLMLNKVFEWTIVDTWKLMTHDVWSWAGFFTAWFLYIVYGVLCSLITACYLITSGKRWLFVLGCLCWWYFGALTAQIYLLS